MMSVYGGRSAEGLHVWLVRKKVLGVCLSMGFGSVCLGFAGFMLTHYNVLIIQ